MEIYKLVIFLKSKGRLYLVDQTIDENKSLLMEQAQSRKQNNSDYLAIINSYKVSEATII